MKTKISKKKKELQFDIKPQSQEFNSSLFSEILSLLLKNRLLINFVASVWQLFSKQELEVFGICGGSLLQVFYHASRSPAALLKKFVYPYSDNVMRTSCKLFVATIHVKFCKKKLLQTSCKYSC